MPYWARAKRLFDEARAVRRQIHQNPETGFELPEMKKEADCRVVSQSMKSHLCSHELHATSLRVALILLKENEY